MWSMFVFRNKDPYYAHLHKLTYANIIVKITCIFLPFLDNCDILIHIISYFFKACYDRKLIIFSDFEYRILYEYN